MNDDMSVEDWSAEREASDFALTYKASRNIAEGDSFEFMEEELKLAKALGMAVAGATNRAIKLYNDETGLSRVKSTARKAKDVPLEKVLAMLDPTLQGAWTMATDRTVTGLIERITLKGAARAGARDKFKSLPTRQLMEAGMVASAKYFTNTYFNRVVMPSLIGDIRNKEKEGKAFDDKFYREVRGRLDKRLKSLPHWRGVATTAASSAYHYGLARAGLGQGYTGYELVAVLDNRTSEVCEALDGRRFWLADAVNHVEKRATIPPEDMKDEMPFPKWEEIHDHTQSDLTKAGILTPPFHPFCRTTMRLIR